MMEVINYTFDKWENIGMYKTYSEIKNKEKYYNKCLFMFNQSDLFYKKGIEMIDSYNNCCSTFLLNTNVNRVAFIGQSTAYYYCKCPEIITKEVFKSLPDELKILNNNIAKKILNEYKRRSEEIHNKMEMLWI